MPLLNIQPRPRNIDPPGASVRKLIENRGAHVDILRLATLTYSTSASNPAPGELSTELTSVHDRQDHTVLRFCLVVISRGADLLAAQWIGVWISADLDRVVNGVADGDDGVCAAGNYTTRAKSWCVVGQVAGVTDSIAGCRNSCDSARRCELARPGNNDSEGKHTFCA